MSATVWKGTLEISAMSVPVRMSVAAAPLELDFRLLDPATGRGVSQQFVDPENGTTFKKADLARALTLDAQSVILTEEELQSLQPEKSNEIEVAGFLRLRDVDPIHFLGSYHLQPDGAAGNAAYHLVAQALGDRYAALGTQVRRGKRYHVLVRASQSGGLVLHTLYHAGEVRQPDLPQAEPADPEQVRMARLLMRRRCIEWRPGDLVDTHRRDVLALATAKAKPDDLTAELEASLAAAKVAK